MKRIVLILAALVLFLIMAQPLRGCWELYSWTGEAAYNVFGYSVSGAGDVNDDNYADLIMGAPGNDAGRGRAYVRCGQTGEILYTFTGEAAGDNFGYSVSGARWVDHDLDDDLIIGAPLNDEGGYDAGRAYVFSGANPEDTLHIFTGEAAGDEFGNSVAGAGCVNGDDGYYDLIIGAWSNDEGGSNAGRAYVFSGKYGDTLHIFTGEASGDWFGYSVSGAGDVNNDGYADLIIGAHMNDEGGNNAGRAYVFSGFDGDTLHFFTGEASSAFLGYSVSGAGDVDDDEYDDLIVGAPGPDEAYVFSGQTGEIIHTLTAEGGTFGYSVSGAGDVNNDGHDDLIVGDINRAYVFSGEDGSLLYTFDGEADGDEFGTSVSGAGCVWGPGGPDGYHEVIIGARYNDEGGSQAGKAYVYSCAPHHEPWVDLGVALYGSGEARPGLEKTYIAMYENYGGYHA